MTEEGARDLLRAIANDVATMAAATVLDRTTDPRRVLPEIAPATLWRVLPRLLRKCAPHVSRGGEFCANLADAIESGAGSPEIEEGGAT